MSRTDKDVPWWVAATLWEPIHWRCYDSFRPCRAGDCDLPDGPVRERPVISRWRGPHTGCHWRPVRSTVRRMWNYGTAPRWYVRHEYHDVQRTIVRDTLRAAVREYNGHGDTDLAPEPIQGRHSAAWNYW